jgi:hypothetical protein
MKIFGMRWTASLPSQPIYLVLRFSDGEGPKMGEIYKRMDNMVGEIKDIMTQDDNPHKLDYPDM